MRLRPMANLFAVANTEPDYLDRMEGRLAAAGEFDRIWRPAPGWLAAQAMLPESEPDGDAVCSRGFAFVEGRDRLERGRGLEWLEEVAALCDHSPHRLAELSGDFGFVRFRPDGAAVAVRSCGGLVPFYLHRRAGGGLALGTLLAYFPRLLRGHWRPDPLLNAGWEGTLTFIDGRTFVQGVTALPRASHTELSPGRGLRTGVYWDPRPEVGEEPEASPEHPRELRALLIEALARDLDPRGRNLLSLSGGVDSSSLAALAAGRVGRRLSSFSAIPPSEPARSQELSHIDRLVTRYGIEPAHTREWTIEIHRDWIARGPGLPFQVLHPVLCELPRICAEQDVGVLFGGEFADEVCGHRQRMTDWIRHTSLRSLLQGAPLPFGRRDYRHWAAQRLRDATGRPRVPFRDQLPHWARPEADAEYQEWLRGRRAARRHDRRPLGDFADRVESDLWVAMNWEVTAPLGVRRSLPFFNREVLELAFRCHPQELLGPGPKRLLREALRDDVPVENLMRSDKGVWSLGDGQDLWMVDGRLPAAAEGIVRADWFPLPPPDVSFHDGQLLASATRVAEYLERDLGVETSRGSPDCFSGAV